MAKLSNDELIAAFKEMTLIELSDFVKLFEETFDVEAAAPAAVAVKVVKNLAGLGLKEAKDLVDSAPSTIFPAAKKEDAEKAKAEIEEAGGKVTLK